MRRATIPPPPPKRMPPVYVPPIDKLSRVPPALMITLELAVPMWIERVRPRSIEYRLARASVCGDIVAEKGDVLQFGGKGCAEAFNALAEGLAILSFAPGGVTFHGQHWETP